MAAMEKGSSIGSAKPTGNVTGHIRPKTDKDKEYVPADALSATDTPQRR